MNNEKNTGYLDKVFGMVPKSKRTAKTVEGFMFLTESAEYRNAVKAVVEELERAIGSGVSRRTSEAVAILRKDFNDYSNIPL